MKKNDEKIISKLHLPKDITDQCFIMTVIGNKELYIENYHGLLDYNSNYIRIRAKHCSVVIKGKNLTILYYSDEDMSIKGEILTIEYLD